MILSILDKITGSEGRSSCHIKGPYFRINTAIFSGVRIFKTVTVILVISDKVTGGEGRRGGNPVLI